MHHGAVYSYWELAGWVLVATVAAIGNAGVPMGCYLLSTAILASLNVPLHLMGVILPFYALIDMLESAINVCPMPVYLVLCRQIYNPPDTTSSACL